MRQLIVIFLVNCLTIATVYASYSSSTIDYDREWINYKLKYSKSYSNVNEDEARKRLWRNNLDKVNYHNDKADRGLRSYRLTVNQFTDLVTEEIPNSDYYQSIGTDQFTGSRLGLSRLESNGNSTVTVIVDDDDDNLPEAVDWRNHGWVSSVRHRRGCWQSGWAFAIIDAIEGQVFNATKRLTRLSVASLIDCSFGSNHLLGCLNGTIKDGYDYLMDNNGLPIEKDYPYSGYRRRCRYIPPHRVNVTIKGYQQVEPSEKALKRAVAIIGPISVMMDGGGGFSAYSSGIYNDRTCGSRQLNHGVTIVGYGSEGGRDYWIVRNNNGDNWGERGYVRIIRNMNNLCGLASQAYYPII